MLDVPPYKISFSNHAREQLKSRFFEIWMDQERELFESIELVNPSPRRLFRESIDMNPKEKDNPGKYHPKYGILFLYDEWATDRGSVTTVTPGSNVDTSDFPTCTICGNVTDARLHDPCPFCRDEWIGTNHEYS